MAEPTPSPSNIPPYTPMSSLAHELGIMFGFMAACVFVMVVYTITWREIQHRSAKQDLARRKNLHARGIHRENKIHEKMVDRIAMPVDRAELPVHQADR